MTIVELSRLLASRKVTSRQLVEQSLAAIKEPQGRRGARRTFPQASMRKRRLLPPTASTGQRRAGAKLHAPGPASRSRSRICSTKAGVVTLGGSKVLVGNAAGET